VRRVTYAISRPGVSSAGGGWSSSSRMLERNSEPQFLAESLDSILMEQRGRLVIIVSRTDGRVVRLLPPCARALP